MNKQFLAILPNRTTNYGTSYKSFLYKVQKIATFKLSNINMQNNSFVLLVIDYIISFYLTFF